MSYIQQLSIDTRVSKSDTTDLTSPYQVNFLNIEYFFICVHTETKALHYNFIQGDVRRVGLEHKDFAVEPGHSPLEKKSLLKLIGMIKETFADEKCDAWIVSPGGPRASPFAQKLKERISPYVTNVDIQVRPDSKAIFSVTSGVKEQPSEENKCSVEPT